MITKFKIYEQTSIGRVINIKKYREVYFYNFEKIHPEIPIRNKQKDIKTLWHCYREDIRDFLEDREVELYTMPDKKYMKGRVEKVTFYDPYNKVALRINGRLYSTYEIKILDNIYKTEIEEQLDLLVSTNKFNI